MSRTKKMRKRRDAKIFRNENDKNQRVFSLVLFVQNNNTRTQKEKKQTNKQKCCEKDRRNNNNDAQRRERKKTHLLKVIRVVVYASS